MDRTTTEDITEMNVEDAKSMKKHKRSKRGAKKSMKNMKSTTKGLKKGMSKADRKHFRK